MEKDLSYQELLRRKLSEVNLKQEHDLNRERVYLS